MSRCRVAGALTVLALGFLTAAPVLAAGVPVISEIPAAWASSQHARGCRCEAQHPAKFVVESVLQEEPQHPDDVAVLTIFFE